MEVEIALFALVCLHATLNKVYVHRLEHIKPSFSICMDIILSKFYSTENQVEIDQCCTL